MISFDLFLNARDLISFDLNCVFTIFHFLENKFDSFILVIKKFLLPTKWCSMFNEK